jgi:hypothetical protein
MFESRRVFERVRYFGDDGGDSLQVERCAVALDQAFGILEIFWTSGDQLVNDEIFGSRSTNLDATELHCVRAIDGVVLE